MTQLYDPWYQQLIEQLQQGQQNLGPKQPPGPNDWTNNVRPNGTLAGAQVTPQPPGYGQPRPAQAVNPAVTGAIASQISGNTPSMTAPWEASSGLTAPGSGYPATEAALQGGDAALSTPLVGGSSPVPPTTWFSSIGPYLQGAAVLGIGAYTAGKGLEALKNSEFSSKNPLTGLKEGIDAAGPLNAVPVLGQLPWIAGALGAMFGSGKDKDQHMRDQVREELKSTGFLNPDFTLTLPNGESFDWGKDGNARLPNEGIDPLTGKDWRHYYDVDWSKEKAGGVVAAANPLAAAFARGDKKLTRDFAGYIANSAMASGDPLKGIHGFIEKAGLDHDKLYGVIHLMSEGQGGDLDDDLADAYKNGLDQLYGVGAYKGKGSQLGTPDIKPGEQRKESEVPTFLTQQTKRSPFLSSPLNTPAPGMLGKQRVSPGVWKDEKGQYFSKTGARKK